eukprot:1161286-Pelagomonas_calceolata.AAC.3
MHTQDGHTQHLQEGKQGQQGEQWAHHQHQHGGGHGSSGGKEGGLEGDDALKKPLLGGRLHSMHSVQSTGALDQDWRVDGGAEGGGEDEEASVDETKLRSIERKDSEPQKMEKFPKQGWCSGCSFFLGYKLKSAKWVMNL